MVKKTLIVLALCLPLVAFGQDNMQGMQENMHFNGGKMVGGVGFNLSGLGTGFGANFEYGLTKHIGISPAINIQSYSSAVSWSFTVIDAWASYHKKLKTGFLGNFAGDPKVDSFIMAGPTFVSFKAGSESSSKIAFGFGAGARYYINNKLSILGEGRYRFASFSTDHYNLAIAWYSIGVGVQYAIN